MVLVMLSCLVHPAIAAMNANEPAENIVLAGQHDAENFWKIVSLPTENLRVFSWRLGKGYVPVQGMHLTPYVEVGTSTNANPASRLFALASGSPDGRFMVGGVADYSVSKYWTLGFDLAMGKLFLPDSMYRIGTSPQNEDDEGDTIWRTGVSLGYAVGKGFDFVTALQINQLGQSALINPMAPSITDPVEKSVRMGFLIRF